MSTIPPPYLAASPNAPSPYAASAQGAQGVWLLALQATALKPADSHEATLAVLTELARMLGCERISLGCVWRHHVRLTAVSSGDERDRAALAQHLEAAMDESLDERAIVLFPTNSGPAGSLGTTGGSGTVAAHAELARRNGGLSVATVPIVNAERVVGALLAERREAFDSETLRRLQDAALFIGPVLEMQHRLHGPLHVRLSQALTMRRHWLPEGDARRGVLPWLVLPLTLAVIAALPVNQEVVAPARVEGGQQRVLAAPQDGYIAKAEVRPGAEVKAGQLLVTLQDRDLALQRQRWQAEVAQLDKQYREALTQDEPAPIAVARARLEQAQAQLDLAELQLARASITAPFDGVVITGDLYQAAGLPVQRGQALLTLAPMLALKVVAEVDEQDITHLRAGQAARVLFAAQGQAPVRFTVQRVSPVALAVDGRNVFEIEGELGGSGYTVRPGQRGIARVQVGERRVAELAWERLGNWARSLSWRVLG